LPFIVLPQVYERQGGLGLQSSHLRPCRNSVFSGLAALRVAPAGGSLGLLRTGNVFDVLPAFVAGAYGFLRQDIPSKQLIKSLELVALGESVMHPHFRQMGLISPAGPAPAHAEGDASPEANGGLFPRRPDTRSPANGLQAGEQPGDDVVKSLSRRELVILRTLTEGASNKIIARKLVITESTVKVHMKAILRKLRLQNRTQAAIWARTRLGEMFESAA
jgi:two-component system nitrate/nitrite response regulator NarL